MDPRIWQAVSPSGGLHVAQAALTLGACLSTRRRYHNFRMWRSGQRFHEILEEYDPSPSHHRLDTACLLLLAKEIHEAGQLAWHGRHSCLDTPNQCRLILGHFVIRVSVWCWLRSEERRVGK